MKKRLTPLILTLTAVFIFFGIFVYQRYLRPMIANNQSQEISIALNSPKKFVIKKDKSQGEVFSIELEFLGKSSSNLNLVIGESEHKLTQVIQLKKGQIEFDYTNDWYADSCYIEVQSDAPSSGKLVLSYRFLTL